MSYAPEVQVDSTGESRGAAVSFATKEEAIAYIVSRARLTPTRIDADTLACHVRHDER